MSRPALTLSDAQGELTRSAIQVPLDAFLPFVSAPATMINFSDLQAALRMEKYECQMAVRLLGFANLLDRFALNQVSKPSYRLTDTALALLTRPAAPAAGGSGAHLEAALAIAQRQNTGGRFLRVASAGLTTWMLESPEAVIQFNLLVKVEQRLSKELLEFTKTIKPLQDAVRISVVLQRR
jgi:hypothetical protein